MEIKDLYWAAGIIEADGSYYLNGDNKNPNIRISVGMTDFDIIQELHDIFRVGNVTGPYKLRSGSLNWKWEVAKQQDVVAILMTLYPMMHERMQLKTKEMLALWRSFPYRNQRDCKNGHKMGKDNTYTDSNGWRTCKICRRDATRRSQNKKLLGF